MNKKRFRCRIGIHDWEVVGDLSHPCGECPGCKYRCDAPIRDWVCIAPNCRKTRPWATNRKRYTQAAKKLKEERKLLAELKMELIKNEEGTK